MAQYGFNHQESTVYANTVRPCSRKALRMESQENDINLQSLYYRQEEHSEIKATFLQISILTASYQDCITTIPILKNKKTHKTKSHKTVILEFEMEA